MFNVYTMHGKGSQIQLPVMGDLDEVRGFAQAAADLGSDVLVRAFRIHEWGERFEIAFSVLDGKITELDEPVIPRAHWEV